MDLNGRMSPCSTLQNSAFFPWEFWRSGQYQCKHNSDESPGRFLLRMRLKLVMDWVSEDSGKRKHDQSIITWLRIGHSWGKMPWYTIRENKSSQMSSYRGSWWHSNSREASAETEPLLQCRDHGIKRNMGGGNGDAQSNLKERPFKSVDTFKKLHGIQNQTGKGNYLVWPAVRHLEVKMSSWHGLDKPFPKTRPRCFVQQIKGTVLRWPCRHNTVSGTGHNPGTSSEQNPLQPNPDKSHALQLTE